MNDGLYIDYLERVVLALLKEREEPRGYCHDIELEPKEGGLLVRETVSVYNLKRLMEVRRCP